MQSNLCPICYSTFSRREHLRRHISTHSDLRRFVCGKCAKRFNRRDALCRHTKTCVLYNENGNKFPGQVEYPSPGQFSSLEENPQLEISVDEDAVLSPAPSTDHLLCHLELESYQESIRAGASRSLALFVRGISTFALTGIFDPSFNLPASALNHATERSHGQGGRMPTWGLPASVTMMDACDATTSCIWPATPSLDGEESLSPHDSCSRDVNNDRVETTQSFVEGHDPPTLSAESLGFLDYDDCLAVSNDILTRLRNEIRQKRPSQASHLREWSAQLEDDCYTLFGPYSLKKYTEEYWNTWYVHWPVISRATFRIVPESTPLVASMVLLAASYSSDAITRKNAQRWADVVEMMVFADEYFGGATVFSTLNAACLQRRLRALQAAHGMCIYQTFEGNPVAKKRARQSRFNEVVAMARELGFQNGRHTDLESVTKDTFNWNEFVLKEELIRTLVYMIVLDSGFVILYNTVPRVMISEVQTDLVCPEACFQASTATECLQHLRVWLSHPLLKGRHISIADAVKILSGSELDTQTEQFFAHLGELNLFVLVTAFHFNVFYVRNSILPLDQASGISNNMRNWRRIWMLREMVGFRDIFGSAAQSKGYEITQGTRWKQGGFMGDALQFWLLAQVMLDSKRTRGLDNGTTIADNNAVPSQFDQPDMNDLKQYLSKFGGLSARTRGVGVH